MTTRGKLIVAAYKKIDKESAKKIAALGRESLEVLELSRYISATLDMEDPKIIDKQTAMMDIYHKIRPGDPATPEASRALMQSMFFDQRRYDMAKVRSSQGQQKDRG